MSEEKKTNQRKEIVSQILAEKRNWVDAKISKPAPNQQVVIRLMNPTVLWAETDTEVYPSEDAKIGRWVPDYTDPTKGEWHVDPPFPLYDYSPTTDKDRLKEFTVVTHWAVPNEGEIDGWNTRFDQINLFKHLNIEVDEEHEEMVYRALLFGAGYMSKFGRDEPEMQMLATVLYDLQCVMDSHKPIHLSDEEYEEMVKERAAKAEAEATEKIYQEAEEARAKESGDGEPEDKGENEAP